MIMVALAIVFLMLGFHSARSAASDLVQEKRDLEKELELVEIKNEEMRDEIVAFEEKMSQLQEAYDEAHWLISQNHALDDLLVKQITLTEDRVTLLEEYEAVQQVVQEEAIALQLNLVRATVTNIVDGDTIDVNVDGVTEQVRLIGIDALERSEPGFREATEFARYQISNVGYVVWLERSGNDRDQFERLRRYVWLGVPASTVDMGERAELLLNQRLLDSGYAVVWTIGGGSEAGYVAASAYSNDVLGEFCGTENRRGYVLCIAVIPEAPTHFRNCDAMRVWYPRGVPIGHPAYASARDGDNDGWACE